MARIKPIGGADENKSGGAAEHEDEDIAALRAQRHAHADFVRALHDEKRHHAVNPDRSEHERDRGEDPNKTTESRRGAIESEAICSSVRTFAAGKSGSMPPDLAREWPK